MNTTENNKLIAEFMGFKLQNNPNERFYENYFTQANGVWGNRIEILHFDSDWNWLMQVVEKIESLGYSTELKFIAGLGNTMFFISGGAEVPLNRRIFKTKIEAVYNACVTFIEWYNKQNK